MSDYDPDAPAKAIAAIDALLPWDELGPEYHDRCRRYAQAAIDALTAQPPPPGGHDQDEDF